MGVAVSTRGMESDPTVPVVGRSVVVSAGRKVPKGTTGTVVWFGLNDFKRRTASYDFLSTTDRIELGYYRVGVKLANGSTVWLNAANVTVMLEDA